jgi:hypothetical protein
MDTVNSYFESLDWDKRIIEILPRFRSFVNHSGMFLEKTLETAIQRIIRVPDTALPKELGQHPDVQTVLDRDLKANLYLLKNFAADQASCQGVLNSRSLAVLRKSIDYLLKDIIRQQGRAVRRADSTEPFQFFSFALPLAEDRQPAKLKVYFPKKENGRPEQGFRISLLLSLDRLEELRTDLHLLNQDLKVTFFTKSQQACAKIQKYQMDLQRLLTPLFRQTVLRVVVSEKKIADFIQEDVQSVGDRRVDLRI